MCVVAEEDEERSEETTKLIDKESGVARVGETAGLLYNFTGRERNSEPAESQPKE